MQQQYIIFIFLEKNKKKKEKCHQSRLPYLRWQSLSDDLFCLFPSKISFSNHQGVVISHHPLPRFRDSVRVHLGTSSPLPNHLPLIFFFLLIEFPSNRWFWFTVFSLLSAAPLSSVQSIFVSSSLIQMRNISPLARVLFSALPHALSQCTFTLKP